MPHYFMHLRDDVTEILDIDGVEMPADAVAGAALAAARDCMAHDVRSGRLELQYRIDIQDDRDTIVHSISFADAIVITR